MKLIYKVLLGIFALFVLFAIFVPVETDEVEVIEDESSYKKTGIVEGLKEAEQLLTEMDKLHQCTKICSGEDYNIPVIKLEWEKICHEAYFYLGEEGLDEQIEKCK